MNFIANPENTAAVEAMTEMLKDLPIGETVTHEAISKLIGRDIRKCRDLFYRARTVAEQETGSLFENVVGIGYKRIHQSTAPEVGHGAVRAIRGKAKRTAERLATVRGNDLSDRDQKRLLAYRSHLGALAMMADARRTRRLEKEINGTGSTVDAGRVLDLFKGRKEAD